MQEIIGDIFDPKWEADAICCTTNGVVKPNGLLTMGKGIAEKFAIKYPKLPEILGEFVYRMGNKSYAIYPNGVREGLIVITIPTKIHWQYPSPIPLIRKSLTELVEHSKNFKKVLLPRPGCGNGQRDWEKEIKPICLELLDDRFYIITPK